MDDFRFLLARSLLVLQAAGLLHKSSRPGLGDLLCPDLRVPSKGEPTTRLFPLSSARMTLQYNMDAAMAILLPSFFADVSLSCRRCFCRCHGVVRRCLWFPATSSPTDIPSLISARLFEEQTTSGCRATPSKLSKVCLEKLHAGRCAFLAFPHHRKKTCLNVHARADMSVEVDPNLPRWSDLQDGVLRLQQLDLDSIRILNSCMAQTVNLQFFEGQVDKMYEIVDEVHQMLEKGSRLRRLRSGTLFRHLGTSNAISNNVLLSGLRNTCVCVHTLPLIL